MQHNKNLLKKTMAIFLALCVSFFCVVKCPNSSDSALAQASPIKSIIEWLFSGQRDATDSQIQTAPMPEVYVGGVPLGFVLNCDGVVVVAVGEVVSPNGTRSPGQEAGIVAGDIVYSICDKIVTSAGVIENLINHGKNAGRELDVTIKRAGATINTKISPCFDISSGKYKLGLWIRDDAAGVGTLTYIRVDNGRFGALGHPVCDIDTGSLLPISSGQIYACNILGATRGERGKPGELKGLFLHNGVKIGTLDNNNNYGVFGTFDYGEYPNQLEKMPTASKNEIKLGKAVLRCTTNGTKPNDYEVEIIKKGGIIDNKNNMVIRIIDEKLLSETGGIVQGMSGSPVIQNGKLIGAVTHVFVSDPTKGFATFIENMLEG
ncbi:MAG: SpoIVB peptidase [Clostridia bacterium]|nr:SpoIVB peptidase [Clostridia bacterium]